MTEQASELFDLGYKHYEGPRQGRSRARKAVFINGLRTVLGLGRGSSAKVLPILFFSIVIGPALLMALGAAVAEELDLPGHSDYYQIVSVIVILFAAIMAPELLCPDRRTGVIRLYLVRPLTSTDYVVARWLTFFSITLLLIYSGHEILLIGLTLAAESPLDYLRVTWLDIPRFLSAGFVIALFTATLPLAISAFTTRRMYATAMVIGIFIVSSATAGILTGCEDHETGPPGSAVETCEPLTRDYAKWFALVDVNALPVYLSDLIFGIEDESERSPHLVELPNAIPIAWYFVVTGGLAFVLWWRYRRIAG